MVAQIDKLYRALGFKKLWQRLLAYIFFEGRPATTRGRSWNVVVLTWLKVLANNPIPFKPASPVLIVGTGRSGTTLLGILLSSHPELAFLNEPKAAWYVANKRDDIIGTYSSSTGTYLLQTSDATTKIAARIQRIHSAYRNIAGAGQVVDKYPELVFRSGYVHSIYPKSKWIFIARNGYDTALSVKAWCNKMAVNRGGVVEDWWGVDHNKWNAFVAQVVKLDPQWGLRADEILRITSNRLRAIIEWIFSMEYGLALQDCDYINNQMMGRCTLVLTA